MLATVGGERLPEALVVRSDERGRNWSSPVDKKGSRVREKPDRHRNMTDGGLRGPSYRGARILSASTLSSRDDKLCKVSGQSIALQSIPERCRPVDLASIFLALCGGRERS